MTELTPLLTIEGMIRTYASYHSVNPTSNDTRASYQQLAHELEIIYMRLQETFTCHAKEPKSYQQLKEFKSVDWCYDLNTFLRIKGSDIIDVIHTGTQGGEPEFLVRYWAREKSKA